MSRLAALPCILCASFSLALISGCKSAPQKPSAPPPAEQSRVDLSTGGIHGLSGLTAGLDGELWSVAEREHSLLRISGAGPARKIDRVQLENVPPGIDLESLTWLGGGRLAAGTESDEGGRASDRILLITIQDDGTAVKGRVTGELELRYAPLGLAPNGNQGLEGLCQSAGVLLAAGESVIEAGDTRYAPLARYAAAPGASEATWSSYRLTLTTETGKVSALSCRPHPEGLEVVAVERHYGIARLLRFVVPRKESAAPLVGKIILDAAAHLDPELNFEGVTFLDPRENGALTFALIVDNQFGRAEGPSALFTVRAAAP